MHRILKQLLQLGCKLGAILQIFSMSIESYAHSIFNDMQNNRADLSFPGTYIFPGNWASFHLIKFNLLCRALFGTPRTQIYSPVQYWPIQRVFVWTPIVFRLLCCDHGSNALRLIKKGDVPGSGNFKILGLVKIWKFPYYGYPLNVLKLSLWQN